jgi:hypothetical protein
MPINQGTTRLVCEDLDLDLRVAAGVLDFRLDFPPDLRWRRELLKARLKKFKAALSLDGFPSSSPVDELVGEY